MVFHHRDPEGKDFGISRAATLMSWEKIKDELDKCVLLCSNCHAEIHEENDSYEWQIRYVNYEIV
jgi:hypothetical protein